MLINVKVITTSGFFCGSHFQSLEMAYWSEHGRKDDYDLKSGGNANKWWSYNSFRFDWSLLETVLEVLNTPTGLAIVEKSAHDLKSGINVNKC